MKFCPKLFCAALLIAALGATASVRAAVVTINPSKDNTLYQSTDGSLSDGIGPHIYVGENGNAQLRRGLIAFDVASAVPAGMTVTNATLTLNLSRASTGSLTLSLYTLNQNWGEGTSSSGDPGGNGAPAATNDATWLHTFYNSGFWTHAGGDYAASASFSHSFSAFNGLDSITSNQLTTDAQSWLQNPAANFGWILIGNETETNTAMRFDSKDTISGTIAPTLTITYSAVPEPTLALGIIGCFAVMRRRITFKR